jgi:hypothetical protein
VTDIPLKARDGTVRAVAIVDDADAEWVNQHTWYLSCKGYAVRNKPGRRNHGAIFLHREVLGLTETSGFQGDHINRVRLDCRRQNLRVATPSQNSRNVSSHRDGKSEHRGVSWSKACNKWRAEVRWRGMPMYLDYFKTEEEAAIAVVTAIRQRVEGT